VSAYSRFLAASRADGKKHFTRKSTGYKLAAMAGSAFFLFAPEILCLTEHSAKSYARHRLKYQQNKWS